MLFSEQLELYRHWGENEENAAPPCELMEVLSSGCVLREVQLRVVNACFYLLFLLESSAPSSTW